MKKLFTFIAVAFISISAYAQVGINTNEPKSSLHVKESEELNLVIPEGVMTPKFTGNDLILKDNLYTEEQTGTIVYVSEIATVALTDKTVNVNSVGYYYFDGTIWQKMNKEPWKVQGTSLQASNNNENIYQKGNVAIGNELTDRVLDTTLDVTGSTKLSNSIVNGQNKQHNSYFFNNSFNNSFNGFFDFNVVYEGEERNLMSSINDFIIHYEDLMASPKLRLSEKFTNLEYSSISDRTIFNGIHNNTPMKYESYSGLNAGTLINMSSIMLGDKLTGMEMQNNETNQYYKLYTSDNTNGLNEIRLGRTRTGNYAISFAFSRDNIENSYVFPSNIGDSYQQQYLTKLPSYASDEAELAWKSVDDIIHEKINIKSENGNCFQITVSNTGILGTTPITCPE